VNVVVVKETRVAAGAAEIAEALRELGAEPAELDLGTVSGETAPARLAAALRTAEDAFAEGRPDAVVLIEDSDLVLAAGMVAAKLELPLFRLSQEAQAERTVARIDALLATAVSADPVAAAAAIVEVIGANPPPAQGA
jgi:hypothetical protein